MRIPTQEKASRSFKADFFYNYTFLEQSDKVNICAIIKKKLIKHQGIVYISMPADYGRDMLNDLKRKPISNILLSEDSQTLET